MSNPKETWKDNRNNTYRVYTDYTVRVSNPITGTRTINKQKFNQIKNGK